MTRSNTHYERAFEYFLQERQIPYVAVDQARKAIFVGAGIKSFDFIVYPRRGPKILVDVKGRKFSWQSFQRGRLGESWTTSDDVEGLKQWEEVFGGDYVGVFVFAYWLFDSVLSAPKQGIYRYGQRDYAFFAVELSAYQLRAQPRSGRWKTVYVPARQFLYVAESFDQFVMGSKRSKIDQRS